jgi:hypothetical protein
MYVRRRVPFDAVVDFGNLRSALSRIRAGGPDEVHPIETVTVTNQQFLNGENSGKRVVIDGELTAARRGPFSSRYGGSWIGRRRSKRGRLGS